jgi:hypothetical protein
LDFGKDFGSRAPPGPEVVQSTSRLRADYADLYTRSPSRARFWPRAGVLARGYKAIARAARCAERA